MYKCASSHASVVKSARLAGCEGIEPARFSDRVPDLSGDRRITNRNAVWIHSLRSMRGFAASVSIFLVSLMLRKAVFVVQATQDPIWRL